jgi:hypothetical protein
MDVASRERMAPLRARARALAQRHVELTQKVEGTIARATHALERARALQADPRQMTRRAPPTRAG